MQYLWRFVFKFKYRKITYSLVVYRTKKRFHVFIENKWLSRVTAANSQTIKSRPKAYRNETTIRGPSSVKVKIERDYLDDNSSFSYTSDLVATIEEAGHFLGPNFLGIQAEGSSVRQISQEFILHKLYPLIIFENIKLIAVSAKITQHGISSFNHNRMEFKNVYTTERIIQEKFIED